MNLFICMHKLLLTGEICQDSWLSNRDLPRTMRSFIWNVF